NPVEITTQEGETITYTQSHEKIRGLIEGSLFCSQKVEFQCKNSKIGADGAAVYVKGEMQKLNYFPGAAGKQGSCGCGATESCDAPDVTCNCNIDDGNSHKDFGLIIDKNDLPVTKLTAQVGASRSSTYEIGELKCSQKQFGIEPNCEKYHAIGVRESYSYLIDPDGTGGQDPFVVECEFVEDPSQGKTIVHHDNEGEITVDSSDVTISYLMAKPGQIEALLTRSTFCTQEISLDCKHYSIPVDPGTIMWTGSDGGPAGSLKLSDYLDSCGPDGDNCKCGDGQGDRALEGEATVVSGLFTTDPDGAGGADPFTVECTFPDTVIETDGKGKLGPKPDSPLEPVSKCFDVSYTSGTGKPLSPAQVSAYVTASSSCSQSLSLKCKKAPATKMVNFTTCDGKTQVGWAGSYGQDSCACGVNGNCDGGRSALCNCDKNSNKQREDAGVITQTDRLPICQVCLSIAPPSNGKPWPTPTPSLSFEVGELVCDRPKVGLGSCQQARRGFKVRGTEVEEMRALYGGESGDPIPVGCKLNRNPPLGVLTVKPRDPSTPPKDDKPVDIKVEVGGEWESSVPIVGQEDETEDFDLDVEYSHATPDQINGLANISGFCWQGVQFKCQHFPLLEDPTHPSTYYRLYDGQPATSFGTDEAVEFHGCACHKLGVCYTALTCNCDAEGPMSVDQGAITNKASLPITGVHVAGRNDSDSVAQFMIGAVRCSARSTGLLWPSSTSMSLKGSSEGSPY
ncbi:zonadhesin, partial [Elysia marginata]